MKKQKPPKPQKGNDKGGKKLVFTISLLFVPFCRLAVKLRLLLKR